MNHRLGHENITGYKTLVTQISYETQFYVLTITNMTKAQNSNIVFKKIKLKSVLLNI